MSRLALAAIAAVVLALALAAPASATYGLDLSVWQGDVSQDSWNCLAQTYSFAIVQGLQSNGRVNPYAADDIKRAHAAGIQYVDAYLFLNWPQSASQQVYATLDFLAGNGADVSMVWIDVEAPNLWSSNCGDNVAYFREAVNAAQSRGKLVGMYTSASQWNPIACGDTSFSNLPLWYPHYDNWPSFGDFSPFGGWSSPAIKQYSNTISACGTQLDQNFY